MAKRRKLAQYLQRKSGRATYWCLVAELTSTHTLCGKPLRGPAMKCLRDRSPEYPICDMCRLEEEQPEAKNTVASLLEFKHQLRRERSMR